jgi:hypothetical protein
MYRGGSTEIGAAIIYVPASDRMGKTPQHIFAGFPP